ncbi:NAD(P)H-dependent oxidoreductase [Acuticoccus sp. M5D2P5]|uniref:NADPH-dependent FMN reductase n=1 Tax=Acuticoccus kalidii TaxID=2910977 RepID=UPI001F1829E2|nr:NADPH-dependent FMN reductase [Acuticoccus kalidii]MCF3934607.1 NAD(P)H-dependent oxidoreductase [Acuticoccus kalidii]
MARELDVLVICGSLRKGSYNRAICNTLPELAPEGMRTTLAPSFEPIPIYNADIQATGFPPEVTAYGEAIAAADGVIIVSPEYNYSVPGGLKNLIDWISRLPDQPFKGKPVALQSASASMLGGARMQYHLRQTMVFLNAHVFLTPEVFVGSAGQKVSPDGETIADEGTRKVIATQLAAFMPYAEKIGAK